MMSDRSSERNWTAARLVAAKRPTPTLADCIITKPALIIAFARCCNLVHMLNKLAHSAAP